jgi:glycosyltransferase involved in cell wall biosynthesis
MNPSGSGSSSSAPDAGLLRKIAVLGNHAPRHCGIATFTEHLVDALAEGAPEADCFVLAMNDPGERHDYPPRVRFEIAESDLASYRRAADFLNVATVDVLSVQHEYGIFGGKAGAYVLALLHELRMPIVTTLHTILAAPDANQRAVLESLVEISQRLVVMSRGAEAMLRDKYGVDPEKIDVIPHGIPRVPMRAESKERLGLQGRPVILTFGLLSPDKGIESVIDALPAIVARHPETLYLVLGTTHPHVKAQHGEAYRLELEARARSLGVAASVIFHDRFGSEAELGEFLSAADIYITPYLKPEQITSGTLAYAVGAGKAVISTPYWYATELLAEGRGILVGWRDPAAIAKEVIALVGDEALRAGYSERAAAFGHDMFWPRVAERYLASFARASKRHADERRNVFQAKTLAARPAELPETSLVHLGALTDDTGVLQHARFNVPRYEDGYCLDDNARALRLMALLEDARHSDPAAVRRLGSRYLAFVNHAFDPKHGRFRNFMSYPRTWLEEVGSEDSHGRALWALGTVVGHSEVAGWKGLGRDLFHAALPAAASFTSPRAWAFTLLGVDEYLVAFEGDSGVETIRTQLAERLLRLLPRAEHGAWPWFEDSVTYENARLCQALIVSGRWMHDEEMILAGVQSLRWLATVQRSSDGYFAPVGSNGFYRRGGEKAEFDQQPVEAHATVSACIEAARVTGDRSWLAEARRAFDWFLGQNQNQIALYDPATGGCRDGLHADRRNENQGAESTLSYLTSLAELRAVERPLTSSPTRSAPRNRSPAAQAEERS